MDYDNSGQILGTEPERALRTWQRILIYLGVLVIAIAASIYLEDHYHLGEDRAIGLSLGPIFLVAASKTPWWLFDTIRRVRWFGLIKNDTAIQVVLLVIGGVLMVMGLGWIK